MLCPAQLPEPRPGPGQLLVRVHACGVCRTDLHLLDGEVDIPNPPVIPGHQIVGVVLELGERTVETDGFMPEPGHALASPGLDGRAVVAATASAVGEPVRAGSLHRTRHRRWVRRTGGRRRALLLSAPEAYSDLQAAPLLCAGVIGYRALRMTGDAERLGLYGFGSAAHIIAQVARFQGRRVFAFTRPGDHSTQAFARRLGVEWAGDSSIAPPEALDAAIIFASAGELVPAALRVLAKGGIVVCAGIHMSDIPAFPYELLWEERSVRSVANLTREDARELLELAPRVPVNIEVSAYALADAHTALEDLRAGRFSGSAVIDLGLE